MKTNSLVSSLLPHVLADIIQDFLEITCKMPEKERVYLVRELAREAVSSETIEVHPAFSVEGKIIIVGNKTAEECWLYSPVIRRIMKTKWYAG